VVFTAGRRSKWTETFRQRMERSFAALDDKRVVLIPRVNANEFLSLLRMADVILHPFPFDGSRTSADALLVHIPYVCLPTEYLKYVDILLL
jgi:predicted O-linked N-acetylglucosamine transferase (SPINDLY family)